MVHVSHHAAATKLLILYDAVAHKVESCRALSVERRALIWVGVGVINACVPLLYTCKRIRIHY